jgi:hypothetical protein
MRNLTILYQIKRHKTIGKSRRSKPLKKLPAEKLGAADSENNVDTLLCSKYL